MRCRVYSDSDKYIEILLSDLLNEFNVANFEITTRDNILTFKGDAARLFNLLNWLTGYAHDYVVR